MKKYLTHIIIIAVVIVGGFSLFSNNKENNEAPLGAGFETYNFSVINSSDASSTNPAIVKGGFGSLGSITVASSSGSQIRVYDGTATSTGTLIATLKASVAEQTFTFDAAFSTGLVFDVPAAHNGVYTVTYK